MAGGARTRRRRSGVRLHCKTLFKASHPFCVHLSYVPSHFNLQKLLVSHPYKNLMTFGGCKQDFMLVVGHSSGSNAAKNKPTEKHLFAMETSEVRGDQSRNIKYMSDDITVGQTINR